MASENKFCDNEAISIDEEFPENDPGSFSNNYLEGHEQSPFEQTNEQEEFAQLK